MKEKETETKETKKIESSISSLSLVTVCPPRFIYNFICHTPIGIIEIFFYFFGVLS